MERKDRYCVGQNVSILRKQTVVRIKCPVWCAPASEGCLLLWRIVCEESEDVCVYLLLITATIGCAWVVPYYTRAYNTDISLFLVLQSMHLKIVHN